MRLALPVLVVGVSISACAPTHPPVVVPPARVVVDTTPPPPPPPDTMVSWRVPAFRPAPLVRWGPIPVGEERPPRTRTFDLQHQVVRVRFDWARRAVAGSTTLRVAPLADSLPITAIALDAVGMTIERVRSSSGAALRHEYDGRLLTVHLPSPVRGRSTATFTIDYGAVRPSKGVYFIDRRHTVWTQGEAEETRHWVPTFDHPGDRTTWEIFVRTTSRDLALSNGRLVTSRRVGAETEWHWRQDSPAPTYLMSVVTGDYTVLQDRWRSIPVGYWTYPDSVAAAWRGFGKTPRMMEWLALRTGVAYPWNKYDQVVVPDFIYGGMENVTATTMADDAILHPAWAEPHAHSAAEGLVMHELAHQWFGNLVALEDWPHVWLNEGFARMLEAAWREEDHGRDEAELTRAVVRDAAVVADLRSRRPLVWNRYTTDPIELFLSGHVYARGAAVLEMLRAELGDSLFWAGVQRYLAAHRLGNVTTGDLRAAMEAASGRDLAAFFESWVHGAGFPAFRVSFAYDTAQRTLALEAHQVQPRDSMTGWFAADIEIEVLTDSGPARGVVVSRDSVARLELALRAPPRAIVWDRGARLLHVADFPRSTVMLAHQLEHAGDVPARLEAVRLLGERLDEPKAIAALARAVRADSFWALRARAASALAGAPADSVAADSVIAALLAASGDADPRVREAAAASLGPVSARASVAQAAAERLDSLARSDPSRLVRAAAVRSMAAFDRERALRVARLMLARDAWLDVERRAALDALALLRGTEAWELARGALGAARPATRTSAIAALVATGAERADATSAALSPLLEDDVPSVRAAAARALGTVGDGSALAPLESRALREQDSAARSAMDAAIQRLRGGPPD